MRSLLLILLITGTSVSLSAQKKDHHQTSLKIEADSYYFAEQYNLAAQYYQELANLSDQDAEVNYQLAESYRMIFKYKEAEAYYLKVHYQASEIFPLSLYYYSLMLKLNGEFDQSINYFDEFITSTQFAKERQEYLEQAVIDRAGCEMARKEVASPIFKLGKENINSRFNDYAPAVIDSTIMVITSGRVESNRAAIDERYGEAFTDNFYLIKNGSAWADKTKQVFNITNTKYNDGSGCFNKSGTKYYYTICGMEGKQCRLFLTTWLDNKWSNPKVLNDNINFKTYEVKHPAISNGGDTLLFSSNRPGGVGNFDIWMSVNAGDENWGPSINLGTTVNTKLNELSPAFTPFSHVFFLSSDGHQNYGGLDLYMVKRFSNGSIAVYNLDYPFNSNRDDCFTSFAQNKVFFSSNRDEGQGGFDIYSVEIPSIVSFISRIALKNRDARGDVKLNWHTEKANHANILTARNEDAFDYENLTYEKRKLVDQMVANKRAGIPNVKGSLREEEFDKLERLAEGRYHLLIMEKQLHNAYLARIEGITKSSANEYFLSGVLIDSLTEELLATRTILLMDELGEVLKTTRTNEQGEFRFFNVSPMQNLYLRLENSSGGVDEKPAINSLLLREIETSHPYNLENIYFNFNTYTLRPEAMQVLNELAAVLKSYTNTQVEIYAYADDRGADDYNMVLTQKRGQAVINYLMSKGVDQTGIAVIAKGRQKNPDTQIEIQRQFNRRVEFYIYGKTVVSDRSANTYILKAKNNWGALALSVGVNKDELKKLNGAIDDNITPFQPIRIPLKVKVVPEELFFKLH